jgi:2-dehydropantoate 2-reductase
MNGPIAVVGSGAIGLYYGGKLAAAGHDVRFLVRGDLGEFARDGIRLLATDEDLHVRAVDCYPNTSEIGPCDFVLVAVKTTSNDALAQLLPPLIHSGTILLTLQNGLGNEELLVRHVGAKRVLGGLCFICLTRRSRTTVYRADAGHLSIGEFARPSDAPTSKIIEMFRASGVACQAVEDLTLERWRKLIWNIPFNALSVLGGGIDTSMILGHDELHRATLAVMQEVIEIARGCGHSLGDDDIAEQLRRTETMGAYKPSTLLDFEAGRPLEIEPIWGEPYRRAVKAKVPAPRLQMLYGLLQAVDHARATAS